MLHTQLLFVRTWLHVGPVSLEKSLEHLVWHARERKLGLISASLILHGSILCAVPAQLLEEGPGVDLIVDFGVGTGLGPARVPEGGPTLLLSLMQA